MFFALSELTRGVLLYCALSGLFLAFYLFLRFPKKKSEPTTPNRRRESSGGSPRHFDLAQRGARLGEQGITTTVFGYVHHHSRLPATSLTDKRTEWCRAVRYGISVATSQTIASRAVGTLYGLVN